MKHSCNFLILALLSFLLLLAMFEYAHAYIDPGTGSYVFQILIAGLLGAIFAMKSFWKNIRAYLFGRFKKKNLPQNDGQ